MNTKSSNKTWIWIVVIVLIAGLVYFYINGSSNQTSSTLTATSDTNSVVGAQVLGLLNQIQTLNIDTTIFTDPGYRTLRDYSVVIPPVNVGRPNPFAPLPGSQNGSTNPANLNNSANSDNSTNPTLANPVVPKTSGKIKKP